MTDMLRDRLGALEKALEMAIGFCVDFRETVPDWRRFPQVGVLFAKLTVIREALAAQPAPAVMGEGENWWTAEAIDVIRHARTNEPHDDWNDWQNAITNGILRAYNRGRTAAAESREGGIKVIWHGTTDSHGTNDSKECSTGRVYTDPLMQQAYDEGFAHGAGQSGESQ